MKAGNVSHSVTDLLSARTIRDAWTGFVRHAARRGFPHQHYVAYRVLRGAGECAILDGIELSSLPSSLSRQIALRNLGAHLPMRGWFVRNRGAQGFDWARRRRAADQLSEPEEAALALFEQFGHGAGIALSLADIVPRMRAGILFVGGIGASQDMVDAHWRHSGRELTTLASLLHQRLSCLPYSQPEKAITLRQREALELTGLGFSTQDIATRMQVSVATVEKHLRLARRALGARSTTHAVLIATSRRIIYIDPGEPCTAPPGRDTDPNPMDGWHVPGGLQAERPAQSS